jgi:hypothetical protein
MGLADMLEQLKVQSKIHYDAIPFLMRLLPMTEKPRHWHNNFQFRIRNKITNWKHDRNLLQALKSYDIVVISECMPNAFWRNYLDIEGLKRKIRKPIISYTDAFVDNCPIHYAKWFCKDDFGANRYDLNLFPSEVTEKRTLASINARAIGVNIAISGLRPVPKKEFIAVIDFAHSEFESYRYTQLKTLESLGIKTIILQGRYPIQEIRKIYQQASVFFLAFPETFGLPIAECLASGAYIFTPTSAWPMAWRLNENPMPWGTGELPNCFRVYDNGDDLKIQLTSLLNNYDLKQSPNNVFEDFMKHYPHFYSGNLKALENGLNSLN